MAKAPECRPQAQPVTLDSHTPQGPGHWRVGTASGWAEMTKYKCLREWEREEKKERRRAEREREGKQVVLKWETKQMFPAAVNSHDRQQTLWTSLWGRFPLPPAPLHSCGATWVQAARGVRGRGWVSAEGQARLFQRHSHSNCVTLGPCSI